MAVFYKTFGIVGEVLSTKTDVVLVDAKLSDSGRLVGRIRDSNPSLEIIAVGVDDTTHDVVRCAAEGYSGFIPANASLNDFSHVVREAVQGILSCSPRVTGDHPATADAIARELSIGLSTVKNHVHNVLNKLQVKRRADAARVGRSRGPVPRSLLSGGAAMAGQQPAQPRT